jgi:hypothetical protein
MISVRSNCPAFSALMRLQRHVDLHTRRHVDEAAARPDGGVQGGELVVVGRNDRAEVLPDDLGVFANCGVHVAEQDPEALQILAILVVHNFRLVLRGDAGEVLPLRFGDAELLVGGLHGLGKLFPLVDLVVGRLDVIEDVLKVQVRHVDGEPGRHRLPLEVPHRPQPEVGHPVGLALPPRDIADDGFAQALLGLVDVALDVTPAQLVPAEIEVCGCHGG